MFQLNVMLMESTNTVFHTSMSYLLFSIFHIYFVPIVAYKYSGALLSLAKLLEGNLLTIQKQWFLGQWELLHQQEYICSVIFKSFSAFSINCVSITLPWLSAVTLMNTFHLKRQQLHVCSIWQLTNNLFSFYHDMVQFQVCLVPTAFLICNLVQPSVLNCK